MRRRAAALMTALALLLLPACGRDAAGEAFEGLRSEVSSAASIRISADVTTAGENPEAYSLTLTGSGGEYAVTLTAPASLAGVSVRFGSGGERLEYAGLVLDAGELNGSGLSAITALPLLADALAEAHVALSWSEGEESVVSLVPDDSTGIDLRLDAGGRPVSAEFISTEDGRVLAECAITEFSTSDT